MNIRKAAVIVPLMAGAMMLPAGVTAASASPTQTASGAVTQATQAPSSDKDYRQGYRDGYNDGWDKAEYKCRKDKKTSTHRNRNRGNRDYERGYDKGFDRGYDAYKKKHWRECRHH